MNEKILKEFGLSSNMEDIQSRLERDRRELAEKMEREERAKKKRELEEKKQRQELIKGTTVKSASEK